MAKLNWQKFFPRSAAGRATEIMFSVADGAAAATNIAVSGITLRDGLIAVIGHSATGELEADHVAEASITSAGNIQLSTTATTGDKLLVIWAKRKS